MDIQVFYYNDKTRVGENLYRVICLDIITEHVRRFIFTVHGNKKINYINMILTRLKRKSVFATYSTRRENPAEGYLFITVPQNLKEKIYETVKNYY